MPDTSETILWTRGKVAALAAVLALWFAAAAVIGTVDLLPNRGGSFLAPIALTAILPVVVFLGIYLLRPGFRSFVLAQDIEILTMLHLWRVIGFAFLPLYFFGILPGLFAWPAGLGDLAVGLAAPFVVLRLRRAPDYVTSAGLVRFHYFGLLDFAVAVATAGLSAGAYPALVADGVTGAAMDGWPMNLFPSFLVPVFIILHLTVLLKVRHLRRREARRGMNHPNVIATPVHSPT